MEELKQGAADAEDATAMTEEKKLTRRAFLGGAVAGAAILAGCSSFPTIIPRHVLGGRRFVPPSEKVRIAKVGCGLMGKGDIEGVMGDSNIVALCDVDWGNAAPAFKLLPPNVPKFKDYRIMLDKMGDQIDAVMVSTPDNTHAVISMAAMRRGKHVFCQKPLAHDIYEVRAMTEAARHYGVASLMGIQGHAGEGIRLMDEWINTYNVIGKVREVHIWTDRLGWNSQWTGRPTDTPPLPKEMDWDLWIGPAPMRPFSPDYHPSGWRAWWDFGCGALGDIGCHSMDAPFHVLKLGYPTLVTASISNASNELTPNWSIITYEFAARGDMPPVKIVWYDGGKKPPVPKGFAKDQKLEDNGQIFIGDDGEIICGMYGDSPRILPLAKMREVNHRKLAKVLPRSIGHYQEWLAAIKGGAPAGANFDYSGPLTEVVSLGNIAIRAGHPIQFDPHKLKVVNYEPANQFIKRQYRKGWTLKG